jgi:excisionase family DNA binding protein
MNDPLLTPAQAAKRIGVSHATVCRWLRDGAIQSEPRGPKRRLIKTSVVDALTPRSTCNNSVHISQDAQL